MPAAQCAVSFVIWIAFGILWGRRAGLRRIHGGGASRGWTAFRGAAMLVYGAGWLLGGLYVVQTFGGLTSAGFKIWAWLVVTAAGLEFVRAQMVAAATMARLVNVGDTRGRPESSKMQEREEPEL